MKPADRPTKATTGTTKAPRRYRSPLREQQAARTRHTIVEAARVEFAEKGWVATGMRDIAAAAGVALETVYAHFSSKRGVLQAVADTAVVGDDAPLPLADRADFRALDRGSRPERIRAAAALLTGVQGRTAMVAKLLREAAPTDDEIAQLLQATRARQRRDVADAFRLLVGRPGTAAEIDGVWALSSPEVYLLLVDQAGWTAEQYESWIGGVLERVVARH